MNTFWSRGIFTWIVFKPCSWKKRNEDEDKKEHFLQSQQSQTDFLALLSKFDNPDF